MRVAIDARNLFVDCFVFPALQAGAMYEGKYPLATALGRPLIAKLMVDAAKILVYYAGDRESLGKDFEAAMALSRGKPVIFYCDDEQKEHLYRDIHPLMRLIEFDTGVAVGTVVTIGAAPVFTGILSMMTGRRSRPGARWLAATAAAVAGCAMLVISGHASGASAAGVAFALFASFCYAVYAVTASYLITNGAQDGLSLMSVFVQRGHLQSRLTGWSRVAMGGSPVYSDGQTFVWSADGYVYTLVAAAPPQTVARVVAALPHDGSPGLLGRLRQGVHRLLSWVIP